MNDIKVSLTIILPGRVMFSKQECLKQLKETYTDKRGYKRTKYKMVEDWDKYDVHHIKAGKDIVNVHTRRMKPATQSINLTSDAYKHMVSNECPEWMRIGAWSGLKAKARLELHLKRIAEHLGGVLLEYQVFED